MPTGYWRIKFEGGVVSLTDHTPNDGVRTDLVVQINTPGNHAVDAEDVLIDTTPGEDGAAEQTILTDAGYTYYLSQAWSYPISIEPGEVPSVTGSTFPDGVYRIRVNFSIGDDAYTFDEYFLHTAAIDECISAKLEAYLASSCTKCKSTKQLNTLSELVVLRQGTQLDINQNRITAAEEKVTLMSNICTGSSCTCPCGCS